MDKKVRTILVLLIILTFSYAQEDLFLYQKGSSSLTVTISRSLTISGNVKNAELNIKTLAFRDAPGQELISQKGILEFDNKTYEAEWQKDTYGNNYAVFTIKGINLNNENKTLTYRIEAEINTNYTFLPSQLFLEKNKFSEFTEPTAYIDSNNPAIKTLVDNFFTENDFNVVVKIMNWVNNYLSYDLNYAQKAYKASEVLAVKKGTCDEFSNLTAALLRAKKIPVKFVEGIVYGSEGWQQHAWLLFYANEWFYAEPTFLQLLNLDSLHIIQGIFKDYEESKDSFSYTQGLHLSQGKTQIKVQIKDIKDFEKLMSLKQKEAKLFSNVPGVIQFDVENKKNSYLCIPFTISTSEEIKIFGDSSFLSCLAPNSTKSYEIQLLGTAEVKENTYMQYTLFVQTLNAAELKFKLYPSQIKGKSTGQFLSIKSISAYRKDNKNIIDVTIENFSSQLQPIKFYFGQSTVEKEVAPNSQHTFSFTLPLNINKIDFAIKASSLDYNQTLYFPEAPTIKTPKPKKTAPTKKTKETPKPTEQELKDIDFMFLASVAVILFIVALAMLFKKFKSK